MKEIRYVVIRFIVFDENMLIRLILLNSNKNYLLLLILSASFYVLNFFFIIFTPMYKIIITMFCSFHDIIEIKNSDCGFPVSNHCHANKEIILCKYNQVCTTCPMGCKNWVV